MREEFKSRLLEIANKSATNSSFKLTLVAQGDLEKFINTGVDTMTSSEFTSDHYRKIAEDNIIKLIEAMKVDAGKRSLNESLDYKAFSSARMSVCPLWPFC